jgi:hypothetical protein
MGIAVLRNMARRRGKNYPVPCGVAALGFTQGRPPAGACRGIFKGKIKYISSKVLSSEDALQMIRGHWSIENKVHWQLDVAFREDSWKVRQRIAAQNLSLARKICLNILQRSKTKGSKRMKMKKAS